MGFANGIPFGDPNPLVVTRWALLQFVCPQMISRSTPSHSGLCRPTAHTPAGSLALTVRAQQGPLDLPTSKRLSSASGAPQRLNSLPRSLVFSPDGRYAVVVKAGYGTFDSGEVSGDGHVWSNAAIGTDSLEKGGSRTTVTVRGLTILRALWRRANHCCSKFPT